jgi:hypothetical protein
VVALTLGTLSLLGSAPAFSANVFPYSPNETGENVAQQAAAAPMSIGRSNDRAPIREVLSTQDKQSAPLSIHPYSPNETGEYVAQRPIA